MGEVPPVLRDVILDFVWDRERLWGLQLPEQEVPVSKLRWHLTLPLWSFEGLPFSVSPEQVLTDPARYWAQYERTMAADLSLPLHVVARPRRRLTILDGTHRLLKAQSLGLGKVVVRKATMANLDDIVWQTSTGTTAVGR
jgi:hypothetical protein